MKMNIQTVSYKYVCIDYMIVAPNKEKLILHTASVGSTLYNVIHKYFI